MRGRWSFGSTWLDRFAETMLFLSILPSAGSLFNLDWSYSAPVLILLSFGVVCVDCVFDTLLMLTTQFKRRESPALAVHPTETIKIPAMWPPSARDLPWLPLSAAIVFTGLLAYWGWRKNPGELLLLLGFAGAVALVGQMAAMRENAGPQAVFTVPAAEVAEARTLLPVNMKAAESRLAKAGLTRHDARRLTRWLAYKKRWLTSL